MFEEFKHKTPLMQCIQLFRSIYFLITRTAHQTTLHVASGDEQIDFQVPTLPSPQNNLATYTNTQIPKIHHTAMDQELQSFVTLGTAVG